MCVIKLGDADWTRHVLNFKKFAPLPHFVNEIRIFLLIFCQDFLFLSFEKQKVIKRKGTVSHRTLLAGNKLIRWSQKKQKKTPKSLKCVYIFNTNGSIFAKMGISGVYMLKAVLIF